jgi:hypothetical protein
MRQFLTITLLGSSLFVTSGLAQNWVASSPTAPIPPDAIVAGYDSNAANLYICRGGVSENYGLQPGKFRPGLSGCDFGFKGKEETVPDFDILVTAWQDDSGGNVPADALVGGCEAPAPGRLGCGASLYYCRATVPGVAGLIPGKVRPGLTGCHVSYAGKELVEASYAVLVSPTPSVPFTLVAVSGGGITFGAIRGGTDTNGETLSICVGSYGNGQHPGKIRPGLGACYIPYGGGEVAATNYSVLVTNWLPSTALGVNVLYDFPTGKETNDTVLYSCRASFEGGLHLGSRPSSDSNCTFGWGGVEQKETSFGTLTSWNYVPK